MQIIISSTGRWHPNYALLNTRDSSLHMKRAQCRIVIRRASSALRTACALCASRPSLGICAWRHHMPEASADLPVKRRACGRAGRWPRQTAANPLGSSRHAEAHCLAPSRLAPSKRHRTEQVGGASAPLSAPHRSVARCPRASSLFGPVAGSLAIRSDRDRGPTCCGRGLAQRWRL